jgi:hypothetical protein
MQGREPLLFYTVFLIHMEPMDLPYNTPIDVTDNITPDEFKRNYLLPEKPVVIRKLWANFPARRKWNIEYFQQTLGDIEVGVFTGGKDKADRSFKVPDLKMKFGEYLQKITGEPCNYRLFLFNIFRHKPELRDDFDWPPLTRLYLKRVPFMFFGGMGSVVRIHQDMDWSNVFLTQLHGRKWVVLFHPKYSTLLYRYPFNVHSSVDIEHPEYDKFPGLKYVEGMHCTLEPGDTLFIPSGYWHYIKYLEGGYAINQRALSPYLRRWLKGFWHVVILSNVDDLMRMLLKKNWYIMKSRISHKRAEKMLERMTAS